MTERKLRKIDALFAAPGQTSPVAPIPVSQRRLEVIPHDLIDAHPKHPFKPYNEKAHPGLLESVQTMGVLQPILLQAKRDGRYTLLAGYKRLYCNTKAGNQEILALVDDEIPDAAAELIVTQTNSTQYGLGCFLPSEMAYALKMELDALTELRRQLKEKGESAEKVEIGNRVYHMVHRKRKEFAHEKVHFTYGGGPAGSPPQVQPAALGADSSSPPPPQALCTAVSPGPGGITAPLYTISPILTGGKT